jgi:hypothetical protein
LTLVKVRAGAYGLDGEDAVVYSIQPSVSIVKKNQNGVPDPVNVTCQQFIHIGNQTSLSNERLEYQLSTMAVPAVYSGPVNISSAVWVDFVLYHGSGMVLDRQRVPVVQDGTDGLGIDSIPRGAWGYWPCDVINGNALPDASGNGRDMVIAKGVETAPGKFGNGIKFLGAGGAYAKETFYPPGDFTWSLWVNKDAGASNQHVISNMETGGGGYM